MCAIPKATITLPERDKMGISGIEALEEAGVRPGTLKIVSIDATHEDFQAMMDGWFQADVECSPLMAPVDREVFTNETVYYPDNAVELLPTRLY